MRGISVHSLSLFLVLALVLASAGCGLWRDADEAGATAGAADEEAPASLVEPFDPPTLEELEAMVEWEEQPVLDAMELMRAQQAQEPLLATVDEALRLRNDSDEANAKILSALGRLPARDEDVDWNATLRRRASADVKSTNPLLMSSTIEFDVAGLTSFGLFTFDWDFRPFASTNTVRSWHSSRDRMYDKVVLREDLTWSDGTPITAHDVVFSYFTIMDPRVPVPAVRSGTSELRWVHAYDDHTLVYFHKEPLATNVWNVNFPVIPRHVYEASLDDDPTLQNSPHHIKYEDSPVTGGPYEFVRRVRNQEIVLRRREGWFMHDGVQVRDKPHFGEIRFRIIEDPNTALLALHEGRIEEMMLSPEQWQTRTVGREFYRRNTKATDVEWVSFHFLWNTRTVFFEDKRVRQAMSYAFDHEEMLNELLYGLYQPSVGIFHPTAWMAPKDPPAPYRQNLDKAEQLLDEAGWIDTNGDGYRDKVIDGQRVRFDFTIITPNDPDRIAICLLLKENLDRIGIVCRVRPIEFTVLMDRTQTHRFQAAFGGWGTGTDPDTSSNIWTTEAIEKGRNFAQYSNPEVDRLFEQAKREFDQDKRAELYGKIHMILWEDQPYTWLYVRNAFYAFSKDLRGYVFSPRGPYNYSPGFSSIWKPAH